MRLALLALLGLLCATSAQAQLVRPGRTPVHARQALGGGYYIAVAGLTLSGDCAKTPPAGLTMTACYDFKNGSYTSDGVTPQASFTAAGGTLPAGCTITTGSGLKCVNGTGNVATVASGISASNYFVAVRAGAGTDNAGGDVVGPFGTWEFQGVSALNLIVGGAVLSSATPPAQIAACASSTTAGFGATAAGAASYSGRTNAAANATLYLGNASTGAAASDAFLNAVRVFTGTCNATNAQAVSAN